MDDEAREGEAKIGQREDAPGSGPPSSSGAYATGDHRGPGHYSSEHKAREARYNDDTSATPAPRSGARRTHSFPDSSGR